MKTLIQELQPKLEDEGFAVFYQAAVPHESNEILIIPVAKEDGSALSIEVSLIEDPQEMYPLHHLLQIFLSISLEVDVEKFDLIKELLVKINLELTLGSFNLHPNGLIFFKYTVIHPKDKHTELLEPLMSAMDISNHIFQTYESHIVSFI